MYLVDSDQLQSVCNAAAQLIGSTTTSSRIFTGWEFQKFRLAVLVFCCRDNTAPRTCQETCTGLLTVTFTDDFGHRQQD